MSRRTSQLRELLAILSIGLILLFYLTCFRRFGKDTVYEAEFVCDAGKDSECLPPMRNITSKYRLAPRLNLAACLIEKSMSTVLAAIMCYLHDPVTYENSNRTFAQEVYEVRFCKNKNEERSLGATLASLNMYSNESSDASLFTVIRDPVDRFISGFTDKCVNAFKTKPSVCYNCAKNITCFLEKFLRRTQLKYDREQAEADLYDVHFSPQNWYCSLNQYWDRYSIIKYGSSGEAAENMKQELFRIFRESGVTQQEIEFIRDNLKEKTGHATQNHPESVKNRKALLESSINMRLFLQLYYYDFRLFGFSMPNIP